MFLCCVCAVLVLCKSQHKPGTSCNICFLYLKVVLGHYAALSIPHTRPGTSFNMCFLYLKSCVGPLLCPHYAPHKARHQLLCVFLGPYAVLALCRSQCKPGTSFNVCFLAYMLCWPITLPSLYHTQGQAPVLMCVSWVIILHWDFLLLSVHPTQSCNVCFLYHKVVLAHYSALSLPHTRPGNSYQCFY